MSKCRERVIEFIDQALKCRNRLDFCGCYVFNNRVMVCDNCKVKKALRVSRSCIVAGHDEVDLLNVRLIGVQDAIEDKLQALLGDQELGEEDGVPNE